jgi:hypothetical protein
MTRPPHAIWIESVACCFIGDPFPGGLAFGGARERRECIVPETVQQLVQGFDATRVDRIETPRPFGADDGEPRALFTTSAPAVER